MRRHDISTQICEVEAMSMRPASNQKRRPGVALSLFDSHFRVRGRGGRHEQTVSNPDSRPAKDRNVIERCYCRLKDFRRIVTRYDKLARNYFSALCLVAAVAFWLY
jgi:hypothetical protein